jgi:hypothetical protein
MGCGLQGISRIHLCWRYGIYIQAVGGNTRNIGIKLTDPIKAPNIEQAKERLDE